MSNNPGVVVGRRNFFALFTQAWRSVTPQNMISGFRATGIYPFDPLAIPQEAFLPLAAERSFKDLVTESDLVEQAPTNSTRVNRLLNWMYSIDLIWPIARTYSWSPGPVRYSSFPVARMSKSSSF